MLFTWLFKVRYGDKFGESIVFEFKIYYQAEDGIWNRFTIKWLMFQFFKIELDNFWIK